jgi:sugar phosphate isomerase/epimerase
VLPSDVYVSTNSFETWDLKAILAICGKHRLEALELSTVDCWDPALLGSTVHPSRFLVHNYFPQPDTPFVLNLASQEADSLEQSRAHCRAAIDLSCRLGGDVYAAHAGYTADLPPDVLGHPERRAALLPERFASYDRAYATLVESAKELSAYARSRGVRFLIENHVLSARAGETGRRLLLMVEARELARLSQDVDDPHFGLLVDVGHLKVSATTLGFDAHAFLDTVAPSTAALHLSDNDGIVDGHRPFGDDAWFLPRLRDFPDATVTIELSRLGVGQIMAVRDTVVRWS